MAGLGRDQRQRHRREQEWEKERERQRELTRLLTIDEKRICVALLERAAARQKAQRQGNKQPAIQVQPQED